MAKTKRPVSVTATQRQIGETVRWVREAYGMEGAEAARVLGIDPSTLNKIERGTRAPSIFFLLEFARRLHVTVELLATRRPTGLEDSRVVAALAAAHPAIGLGTRTREADKDTERRAGTVRASALPAPHPVDDTI